MYPTKQSQKESETTASIFLNNMSINENMIKGSWLRSTTWHIWHITFMAWKGKKHVQYISKFSEMPTGFINQKIEGPENKSLKKGTQ